jgi:predicted lysophospholipase L1 biosynthesis ABC-type transport system permease subunit
MAERELFSEIRAIRSLMERSTRFLSLSGLSGILAGICALIGAGFVYVLLPWDKLADADLKYSGNLRMRLFLIGSAVLILSIGTCIGLTKRNSKRKGLAVWNRSSQLLVKNATLPLFTGGCFALLLLVRGQFAMISPVCLCFYGLALVSASQFTYSDVKWLGLFEIGLGLLAILLPVLGLVWWALGFGVLHLVFGTIIHLKYDRS